MVDMAGPAVEVKASGQRKYTYNSLGGVSSGRRKADLCGLDLA